MAQSKLWISFHHQDDQVDDWAIFLETEKRIECDMWQASGQMFEFEHIHMKGVHPEDTANFKDKWLVKTGLGNSDITTIRDVASKQPVDNEGAYWDCRIFCFEILASLESQGLLARSDDAYRHVRKRLHEKWRIDDGVSIGDSDDLDEEDEEEPGFARVNESDSEDELSGNDESARSSKDTSEENNMVGRKRALSHGSSEQSRSANGRRRSSTARFKDCETTQGSTTLGKRSHISGFKT